MKIAILSTDGGGGGAPRAMRRLASGLIARGHDIDIIQLTAEHASPNAIIVEPEGTAPDGIDCAKFIDCDYLNARRTKASNTFFSLQPTGFDFSSLIADGDYDAVNIHWTNFLLNPETAAPVIALGKPVVFTLHDMGHFTGGCHYSAGCEGYESTCSPCPQLADDSLGMTSSLIAAKRASYRKANVAAVAPSHWLAARAQRSGVFEETSVHRISNSVEVDLFCPADKAEARRRLGLEPTGRYILFGAHHADERRKGLDLLIEAIRRLKSEAEWAHLDSEPGLGLLVFGQATGEVLALGIPVRSFGFVSDDHLLATIYNAADLVVLPSLEDNQPNIMMEAMAVGVPVVSFAVGGMNDVILDGRNGRLVDPYDIGALARAILDLIVAPATASELGRAARQDMLDQAKPDHQASRYEALFDSLRGSGPGEAARSGARSASQSTRSTEAPGRLIRLPERVAGRVATAEVQTELRRFEAARALEAALLVENAEKEVRDREAAEAAARPGRLKRLARALKRASRTLRGKG